MKKVLSFVLVLAMILGSASMAFAAPATTAAAPTKDNTTVPFDDAKDSEVATVLRDLGVLTGDNGKAYLDETITRAEFCAMIVRALGFEKVAQAKAETKFTDVPKNEWYSGYVAVAVAQGVVSGVTETEFMPDEPVSADEAIAFVVKALGFSADHLKGTWPMNFRVQANDLGIVPIGFEYAEEEATRGDVFEVLYNALDINIKEWNPVSGRYQDLNGDSVVPTMNRRLGAKLAASAVYTQTAVTITEANAKFPNGFDASEFIGQTVNVLCKNGTAATNYIGIAGSASDALEGEFTSETAFKLADGTVLVVTDTAATLVAGAVYVNGSGAGTTVPTAQALKAVVEKNAKGEIATLCTVTYEVKTSVVAITSAALAAKVASLAAANTVIPGLVTAAGTAKAEYNKVVLEGVKAIDEIAEDDIVEVYYAGNVSGAKVYKLVVVRDKVAGPVSYIDLLNDTYGMGGKEYEEATITAAGSVLPYDAVVKAGTAYALYLDSEGKIAYAGFADKAPAAPAATSTVAFALGAPKTTTTNAFTEKDGWTSKAATTVELLIPGETESKVYTISAGATSIDACGATSIVAFELTAKGEVKVLEEVTYTAGTDVYVDKYGVGNNLIADDAVVVIANGRVTTSAAYYAPKTAADLKNATWASFTYDIDDATSKIAFVFAQAAAPTPAAPVQKYAYVTGVQYTATGTNAALVIIGDGAKALAATGAAVPGTADPAADIEVASLDAIYAVTVSATYVTEIAVKTSDASIATTKGVTISGNQVKTAADGIYAIVDNCTILAVKDGKFVVVTDVDAALKAGKTVELYNLVPDAANTWYDLVVIR